MMISLDRVSCVLAAVMCLNLPSALHAQALEYEDPDLVGAVVHKPSAAEQVHLREELAKPVPPGADDDGLMKHYARVSRAARLLGDDVAYLAILREAASKTKLPRFKSELAIELLRRENFAESAKWRQQAIEAATNDPSRMFQLANLARELFAQGKDDKTVAALTQAEMISRQIRLDRLSADSLRDYLRVQGKILRIRAALAARQGRWDEADRVALAALYPCRKAVRMLTDDPRADPKNELEAWSELAGALRFAAKRLDVSGRSYDAGRLLNEALGIARDQAMPPDTLARFSEAVGLHRLRLRQFSDALVALERATPASVEGEDNQRLNVLKIACLVGMGRWQDAAEKLPEIMADSAPRSENDPELLSTTVPALVLLYVGQHEQARKMLATRLAQAVRRYGAHHFRSAELRGLHGVALWRGGEVSRRDAALREMRAALNDFVLPANAGEFRDLGIQREIRQSIVETYLDAVSQTTPEQAVAAISYADWLRNSGAGGLIEDLAVDARIDDPEVAGMARSDQDARNEIRGLREYLDGIAPGKMAGVVAQMQARISVLEAQRVDLQARIRQRAPAFEQLIRPSLPAPVEISRQLSSGQAVLAFLPTTDALFAWLISRDGKPLFRRLEVGAARVDDLVARLRRGLEFGQSDGLPEFDLAAAHELGEILLKPFEAELEGKTQLIVSASGSLARIPFGILLVAQPDAVGSGDFAQQPWLIGKAAIVQPPSVSAWMSLAGQRDAHSRGTGLLAWGDPSFAANNTDVPAAATRRLLQRAASSDPDSPSLIRYADIPPLPQTRDELYAIADLLKAPRERDVITGAAATRESVIEASDNGTLAGRNIVIFATHGLMARDLPGLNQPALAMAANGRESEDPLAPLLTLQDVLGLRLAADWIVLSAFNTAAADERAEEALSWLARGFFYSGAHSLLVTNWAVETESARALTIGTFANYALGRGKADSLRDAMLALMQRPQYAHPVFWAPYTLVGDGN